MLVRFTKPSSGMLLVFVESSRHAALSDEYLCPSAPGLLQVYKYNLVVNGARGESQHRNVLLPARLVLVSKIAVFVDWVFSFCCLLYFVSF